MLFRSLHKILKHDFVTSLLNKSCFNILWSVYTIHIKYSSAKLALCFNCNIILITVKMVQEAQNVRSWLMNNRKISVPDDWLEACIEWIHSESEVTVDVDVVDLRAQADAYMPASNNNVNYTIYSNF